MSLTFFDTLFPGTLHGPDQGYVVLALLPEDTCGPSNSMEPTFHSFPWPSRRDDVVAFCLNHRTKDIRTIPALLKHSGNCRTENIAHQWVASADAGDLDLRRLRSEPSLVVETSPGHHHLYWVTHTDDPERLAKISQSIAGEYSSEEHSQAGLVHVPGTTNREHVASDGDPPHEVVIKRTGGTYHIAALEEMHPVIASRRAAVPDQPRETPTSAASRDQCDASEHNPENKVADFIKSIKIVHDSEAHRVPTDTFVDRYVKWARTKTDAPSTYHRAGAVSLLTAVFGEFGSCPTSFDSNLTLWFLLLGPTTRTRKSTAMNLWVDIITDIQNEEHNYLGVSDVTPEALLGNLAKRNGRTTLFYRDEAHGLLYEQDQKRYLAGLRELMTELYGGRVRHRLRASDGPGDEDETKPNVSIRTNFVMFLCGTMSDMTKALTIKDYQSGHLARFLVAEADAPPMTRENMRIEQCSIQDLYRDKERESLLTELTQARDFWARKRISREKKPPGIPFASEALARFNDARYELCHLAESHELRDVLSPTTERMTISIMKCAVLLAMSQSAQEVGMGHVLKAMKLAEEWYVATVNIAGKILDSMEAARQEEILRKIKSSTDGVTQQEIFRTFRTRISEKDIESDLRVLVKAGLVRRGDDGRSRVRYVQVSRL